MSGGTSTSTQQANGNVSFNPTSIGGGTIAVGGSVGQAGVQQGSSSQATGASVGLDFSMPMPMPVQLMNLQRIGNSNFALVNLGQSHGTNVKEFEAKAGSASMFDFNNGDPLGNTDIDKMSMKAGADVAFSGETGKQGNAVMDRFMDGAN